MNGSIWTRAAFSAFRFCKKHSTVILATAATAGLIGTVVTSIKAYKNVTDDLYDAEKLKGEGLTNNEILKIVVKDCYVPALLGLGTIGCIAGETIIDIRKEKSLTATIALVQQGFHRYREGLIQLHGKEADDEVMEFISARSSCDFHALDDCGPDQKVWWYDQLSGQRILAYERTILDGEYHFQRNFVMRGYSNLNDFYEFVGMNLTDGGENLGWSTSDGYMWVDVEHRQIGTDEKGVPIMQFDFIFCPDEDYMREWL